MNSKNQNTSLFQKEQVIDSLKQSFVKLNPNIMIKNPIMFTVEVSTVIMLFVLDILHSAHHKVHLFTTCGYL